MNDELLTALRCSITVKKRDTDCSKCKYRVLSPISDEYPVPVDVTIDGIDYWEGCDCDRMVKDAADELERLSNLKQTIDTIQKEVYQEGYNKGYADHVDEVGNKESEETE